MKSMLNLALLFLIFAAGAQPALDEPFITEHYYKVKWGHAEEFLELYRKNHYPLMKKLQEKGDILRIEMDKPRLHGGEDTRWDYRVILVWKNSRAAYDSESLEPFKKQLYPDQGTFLKEERRRFEVLDAHWDVAVVPVKLDE